MYQMNVDGTLMIAKLKRRVKGGAVYEDITFRRSDGAVESVGSMRITDGLTDAMVPGTRGRFFFVEMVGVRAMHGFQGLDGRVAQSLSPLYERVAMIVAALNIALFLNVLIGAGRIGIGLALLAAGASIAAYTLAAARRGCIRAFDAHLPPTARVISSLRPAAA